MDFPTKTLKDAFSACDPAQALPAGDPRYVDLSAARGDEQDAVTQIGRRISWAEEHCIVQTLAGHRGCGKSTELRRLKRDLEGEGFFVVYVEVDRDVDLEDPGVPDVLLSLLRQLEVASRDAGYSINARLLKSLEEWFAETISTHEAYKEIAGEISSEAQASGGIPLLARLTARVSGILKTGTTSKEEVRQILDRRISQLLERVRLLSTAIRTAVQKAGKLDLVLIVDNLDRIALKDLGDGRSSHEVLFIERGEILKQVGCHTVFTVPISLLYSAKHANFKAVFPESHVLPMVKVEALEGEPWKPGLDLLRELMSHRLDLGTLFAPEAIELLISKSGGVPRDLMRMIRASITMVEEPPVPVEAAERAVRQLQNDYDRSIPSEHWPLLARVHRDKRIENDADHQLMLFNLSVLEYQNERRWCDVHPTIREIPRLRQAIEDLNSGNEPESS